MKRTGWILAVVMLLAALAWAQGGAGGVAPSSRTDFGSLCGIRDTAPQSALRLLRSSSGAWSVAGANRRVGGDMAARVWHESNWMVDMHGALGLGMATMHSGQMCFDPQGRITLMIDRFLEMAQCGCMRITELAFASDGRVTRREQTFVNANTGEEIKAPEDADGFPEVWQFRRLDQLPFYALLQK